MFSKHPEKASRYSEIPQHFTDLSIRVDSPTGTDRFIAGDVYLVDGSPALSVPNSVSDLLKRQEELEFDPYGIGFSADPEARTITACYLNSGEQITYYFGEDIPKQDNPDTFGIATAHVIGATLHTPVEIAPQIRQQGFVVANAFGDEVLAQAFALPTEGNGPLLISPSLPRSIARNSRYFHPVAVVY